MNKFDRPFSPTLHIGEGSLKYLLQWTAQKPISYIVHAYDMGQATDYSADFVWHWLKKEKSFNIRDRGKLGLVNFDSGISYFLGLRLGEGDWVWKTTSKTRVHLINLLVEEFWLKDLACQVYFVPYDSSTLLTILRIKNCGVVSQNLGVAELISKEAVWDEPPLQKFGPTFTSTGKLLWGRYDNQHNMVFSCYEEWDKKQVRGKLLLSSGSDTACKSHFFTRQIELLTGNEFPFQYAGVEKEILIEPGEEKGIKFSINLRRFASEQVPNPWGVPLFAIEDEEAAKNSAIKRNEEALSEDWDGIVKQSIDKYKAMPVVELPKKSWIADFYASLELTRGNTFSPYKAMRHPFSNFCRVYSHNPYDWWHEGEGSNFNRTTFCTVIYDPELAVARIQNILDYQDEAGKLPFCINQNGIHDIMSERPEVEKVSKDLHELWYAVTGTPEVAWQIWNVYLWTGDRDFLAYGYEAGGRNHEWWLKNRDRDGDGLCCWKGIVETMQDSRPPIPTWREIELQHQEALGLNCYLLVQERCLAEMAAELEKEHEAKKYEKMAQRRAGLMNKYMWDEKDKCYYGIDELNKNKRAKVKDISTLLPLWAGLAPVDRAQHLVELYQNVREFKTDFPAPSLALSSPEFDPGRGWYGATWTWFNWLVILGLKKYGCYEIAAELGYKTVELEFNSLERTGHFREYYNSQTGEGAEGISISLYDYEWSVLPAAIVIQILFGVEPTPTGLEILPCFPNNWMKLSLSNLHIRKSKVRVAVERSTEIIRTEVKVNGREYPVFKDRGVKIGWDEMGAEADIKIVQPIKIAECISEPD